MIFIVFFIVAIFFVLAGFFSGIETGIISIDRLKLEKQSNSNKKKKQILHFLENPDRLFGTTLFGTNISIVIVSSLGMFLIHHFQREGVCNISDETATLLMAALLLVFAEIIPKALYRENPNVLVPRFFGPLHFFGIVFIPFVKFVGVLNSLIAKLLHLPPYKGYHQLTKEDISFILSQTQEDEILQENQREMLEDAIHFSGLKAENVMTHRTEIVAISEDMSLSNVVEIAKEKGLTRFPVYRENLDTITGILIIYDILKKKEIEHLKASDLVREASFAPENMNVDLLLSEMQSKKNSMTIVVDSYGGTAGIVTVEDLLEEIVGEIEDEYDSTSDEVTKIDDDTYLVQGFVEIDYLNDEFDMNLPEGDYETIAGLIIDKLARIPNYKTKLVVGDWEVTVNQVTKKKIIQVKLCNIHAEVKQHYNENH